MAERATEYVCVYVCACERTHECMCVWSSGENEDRLCMRVCGLRVCTPMLLPFAAALCCYKCSASASSLCVCSIRIKYCDWLWLWLADSLSSDLVSMNACGCLFCTRASCTFTINYIHIRAVERVCGECVVQTTLGLPFRCIETTLNRPMCVCVCVCEPSHAHSI